MKYPKEFIDQLNNSVNIYDLISQYVELKPAGNQLYTGICPLPDHKEKNESLSVFTHSNSWYCFGCCKGTNAINFLMHMHNWSFLEAVDYLADYLKIPKPETRNFQSIYNQNRTYEILYRRRLWRNEENSLTYLYNRGLTQNTIDRWGLGANGRNRIVFPLYDKQKNVVEFSYRYVIQPPDKSDKYWHPSNYIDKKKGILKEYYNKSTYLYGIHLYDPQASDCIYFCEGNFDAILADQYGLKNCLATFGTNFSDAHLKFVLNQRKHPVFIYDNDKAGIKGMEKACKKCEENGITPYVVVLDEQMDLADTALRERDNLVSYIESHITPYAYYQIQKEINDYKHHFYIFQEHYYELFKKDLSLLENEPYEKAKSYILQQTGLNIETSKQRYNKISTLELYCDIEKTLQLYFKDLYMLQSPYFKNLKTCLHKLNEEDYEFACAFILKITGLNLKEEARYVL